MLFLQRVDISKYLQIKRFKSFLIRLKRINFACMDNCLHCGKSLVHVEGRREKKYCDEICKRKYWQEHKPIKNGEDINFIPKWVIEIEKFCSEEQIKPAELINFYKNYKLIVNDVDFKKEGVTKPDLIKTLEKNFPKEVKAKDHTKEAAIGKPFEPVENTNTFFLKYGVMTYKEIKKEKQ